MKATSVFSALSLCLLAGLIASPAKADDFNKETIVKIGAPLRVQNTVLIPGRYIFQIFDTQSGTQDMVQIFDADTDRLVTTVMGMPAYRVEPVDNQNMAFYHEPAGQVPALKIWYFAGENTGVEFTNAVAGRPAVARVAPATPATSVGGMK